MTPDERRAAQLERLQTTSDRNTWAEYLTEPEAEYVLDDLLAYFDETEPAVADAIRYGVTATQAVGRNYLDDAPLPVFLQVNYPNETKP